MLNAVLIDAVMVQELQQWQQYPQPIPVILQMKQAVIYSTCLTNTDRDSCVTRSLGAAHSVASKLPVQIAVEGESPSSARHAGFPYAGPHPHAAEIAERRNIDQFAQEAQVVLVAKLVASLQPTYTRGC